MRLRNITDRDIQVQVASSEYKLEPGQTITVSDEIGARIRLGHNHVLELVEEEEPTSATNLAEIHEVEVPKPILHVSQMQAPPLEIKSKKQKK